MVWVRSLSTDGRDKPLRCHLGFIQHLGVGTSETLDKISVELEEWPCFDCSKERELHKWVLSLSSLSLSLLPEHHVMYSLIVSFHSEWSFELDLNIKKLEP